MSQINIYASEQKMNIKDAELKAYCLKTIGVLFGSDNYRCDLEHLAELKKAALEKYPDKQDKDMEVLYIEPYESHSHARKTMLLVKIPIEDFLILRQEGKILQL